MLRDVGRHLAFLSTGIFAGANWSDTPLGWGGLGLPLLAVWFLNRWAPSSAVVRLRAQIREIDLEIGRRTK